MKKPSPLIKYHYLSHTRLRRTSVCTHQASAHYKMSSSTSYGVVIVKLLRKKRNERAKGLQEPFAQKQRVSAVK